MRLDGVQEHHSILLQADDAHQPVREATGEHTVFIGHFERHVIHASPRTFELALCHFLSRHEVPKLNSAVITQCD